MEEEDDFESGSLGEFGGSLEDEEEEDEEEDDDDDSPEPKLNFIRVRNDLVRILEMDGVSCVAVHSKVRKGFLFSTQSTFIDYVASWFVYSSSVLEAIGGSCTSWTI